jgi:hypothetical protein
MRRLLLLATLALPPVLGCSKLLTRGHRDTADAQAAASAAADAQASAAPEASETPSASAAPTVTAHARVTPHHPEGPPADAKPCEAGKDTTACTADGFEELTCMEGHWKVVQTCRGSGRCTGEGASLRCDVGTPQQGDACVANAPARCTDAHTLMACKQGHWGVTVCAPPSVCQPTANGGQPGCAVPSGPLHIDPLRLPRK